jgi:hypothetical protein
MKKLLFLLTPVLFLAVTAVGCPACPDPHIPTAPDAGVEPDPVLPPDVDPAEAACKRYEELQCMSRDGRPLWEPTPGGVSCVDVFKNAEKNGVDLHPACIAKIETCEERHACTDKG